MNIAQIFSEDNLLHAWRKVRANNGSPGVDRVSLDDFDKNLTKNLALLRQELNSGSYKPMPVMTFNKTKKGNKQRIIGISTVRDRIVQRAVVQKLEPAFTNHFLPCTYAYVRGRSALAAVNKASMLVKNGNLWVLQLDVADFFDSIDHQILIELLSRVIREKPLLSLIKRLLKTRIFREMGLFDNLTGTIQGSGLSPILSNIYLHPLDREMWKKYRDKYIRYSDDIALFSEERDELDKARELVEHCLEALKLNLQSRKTTISHAADGLMYLGYYLDTRGKGPSEKSVRRLVDKLQLYDKIKPQDDVEDKISSAAVEIRGWYNYYLTLVPLQPPNILSLVATAKVAMETGNAQLAKDLVLKTGSMKYRHPVIAFQIAELCSSLGLKNHALREYARTLELDPGLKEAEEGIRRIQSDEQNIHEVIKQSQLILHSNPNYRKGYLDLSENYEKLGLYGFAEKAYSKAMELDDDGIDDRTVGNSPVSSEEMKRFDFDYKNVDKELFLEVFRGCENIHARQWIDERGRWGFSVVERPLKKKDVYKHLKGDVTLGVYPVTIEDKLTFIVFDIDTAKRKILLEEPEEFEKLRCKSHEDALLLKKVCKDFGMELYIEDSGYKGRHGWLFFSEMISAETGLKIGRIILDKAGATADGLVRELFPMGGSTRNKSIIKLPFGINRKNNRRCLFLDDDSAPFLDQNSVLQNIIRVNLDKVKNITEKKYKRRVKKSNCDVHKYSSALSRMIQNCKFIKFLIDKAKETNYLTHYERIVLLYTLTFAGSEGVELLHKVISCCINYNYQFTQEQIEKRKANPISCAKIMDYFPEHVQLIRCNCCFDPPLGGYPSPVLYLLQEEIQKNNFDELIFCSDGAVKDITQLSVKDEIKIKEREQTILDFENIFNQEEEFLDDAVNIVDNGLVDHRENTIIINKDILKEDVKLERYEENSDEMKDCKKPSESGYKKRVRDRAAFHEDILVLIKKYLDLKERKHDLSMELEEITRCIDMIFKDKGNNILVTKFGRILRDKNNPSILTIEMD
jgi:group II intron reverse transcriptase/maturase